MRRRAYFGHVVVKRERAITELAARRDDATAREDDAVVAETAIVDVAHSSQLAAVGDPGQLRKACEPGHAWGL